MRIDQFVSEAVVALSGCLCEKLAEQGWPEPCFCGPLPGEQVPFDYCDECSGGMAWVRLSGITPIDDPNLVANVSCVQMFAVGIEMGMVVGAALPTENAVGSLDLPSTVTLLTETLRQHQQMGVMHEALTCCTLPGFEKIRDLTYAPIGPDGGCVGGLWTGTITLV